MRGGVSEKLYLQTLEDHGQLNPGQASTLRVHIVTFFFTLFYMYWISLEGKHASAGDIKGWPVCPHIQFLKLPIMLIFKPKHDG